MNLNELRNEIDRIDHDMRELFEKRMMIVKKVKAYKKEHQMHILDSTRELDVIHKNVSELSDDRLKNAYQRFLQFLMDLSKELQQ
ncbi:MAG: chorismate mutase [Acholeplasmataceae bacterium]